MRVVITGAAGFLGSAVRHMLSLCEHIEVVAVSRRSLPGFVTVATYSDTPFGDVLIHLAESSDRMAASSHGLVYENSAISLLKTLDKKGFKRVVYASSAVLYGDQNITPCKENDAICITDSYTRIKNVCEKWVIERGGVAARLSNLYGFGMAKRNVISEILSQLPNDGPVMVHDAAPIRDFLWIEDAARAISRMATSQKSGVFNIGSGVGSSILELANTITDAAGQRDRPVVSRVSSVNSSQLVLDIGQASAEFGWSPETNLKHGIATLLN